MKELTVYEAFDGSTFSDSDTCVRYERFARRWEQAKKQIPSFEEHFLCYFEGGYDHKVGCYYDTVSPQEFLERVVLLQELAAFMVSED